MEVEKDSKEKPKEEKSEKSKEEKSEKAKPATKRRTNMPLLLAFRWACASAMHIARLCCKFSVHSLQPAALPCSSFGCFIVCHVPGAFLRAISRTVPSAWRTNAHPTRKIAGSNHLPCVRRYFDRTGCGYMKQDDLRRLLQVLGCALPHRCATMCGLL